MGLDLVELVIETESEFGLQISELQAEGIPTVGALYSFVLVSKNLTDRDIPVLPRAFCALRRGLRRAFDVPRSQVFPAARTRSLVARESEEASLTWSKLQRAVGLELPPLEKDWPWSVSERIPLASRTIGGLTRSVASLNLAELLGPADPRADIWRRLTDVIVRTLGVQRSHVLLHHHFVHDLDCA